MNRTGIILFIYKPVNPLITTNYTVPLRSPVLYPGPLARPEE